MRREIERETGTQYSLDRLTPFTQPCRRTTALSGNIASGSRLAMRLIFKSCAAKLVRRPARDQPVSGSMVGGEPQSVNSRKASRDIFPMCREVTIFCGESVRPSRSRVSLGGTA